MAAFGPRTTSGSGHDSKIRLEIVSVCFYNGE